MYVKRRIFKTLFKRALSMTQCHTHTRSDAYTRSETHTRTHTHTHTHTRSAQVCSGGASRPRLALQVPTLQFFVLILKVRNIGPTLLFGPVRDWVLFWYRHFFQLYHYGTAYPRPLDMLAKACFVCHWRESPGYVSDASIPVPLFAPTDINFTLCLFAVCAILLTAWPNLHP